MQGVARTTPTTRPVLISPTYEIPRQKVFFVRLMTRGKGERRQARNAGYDAMRRPGGIRVTEERELLVLLSTEPQGRGDPPAAVE
jgi:hypothetical protein